MTAIPAPRPAADQPTPPRPAAEHWCDTCEPCPYCAGGTLRLPLHGHWRAVIHPSGGCWALCTTCGGRGVLCPVLDAQEATQ